LPTLNLSNLPIDGIIFDLDGTLVDSSLDFALIRQQVRCPQNVDMLAFITTLVDPDLRNQAQALVVKHELEDAKHSKWLPGAKNLVNRLHQLNIPQAIVTRNSVDACRLKMQNNQIAIDKVITREGYKPKPAPDALLAIASDWNIAPQRLMYVGDFKYDIQAGNNAGMLSCLITQGKIHDCANEADFCFEQLEQLTRALFRKQPS
jgi:HAD superfamily hydrolase (TIGR01509 family)